MTTETERRWGDRVLQPGSPMGWMNLGRGTLVGNPLSEPPGEYRRKAETQRISRELTRPVEHAS